jgi:hypothetical protein
MNCCFAFQQTSLFLNMVGDGCVFCFRNRHVDVSIAPKFRIVVKSKEYWQKKINKRIFASTLLSFETAREEDTEENI